MPVFARLMQRRFFERLCEGWLLVPCPLRLHAVMLCCSVLLCITMILKGYFSLFSLLCFHSVFCLIKSKSLSANKNHSSCLCINPLSFFFNFINKSSYIF